MITYKQLSLADIFTDCQNTFDNDKYKFLSIFDETTNRVNTTLRSPLHCGVGYGKQSQYTNRIIIVC